MENNKHTMSLFDRFKQKMESLSKEELDEFWKKYDAQNQDGPSAFLLVRIWPNESKNYQKKRDTEKYVDKYISINGKPPSYRQVADWFGLKSTSAAYGRLRHCRHKMKKVKS